ncbi:Tn3 family transposase [Actinomadura sp. NTSP31]|uniref:Tn3 family transposase n=1 Tax=Actinomadura sp. NTSP31 TaxID=1735447 RepID=UPI0035C1146D
MHFAKYLSDPAFRRKISRQLNKGESLHALTCTTRSRTRRHQCRRQGGTGQARYQPVKGCQSDLFQVGLECAEARGAQVAQVCGDVGGLRGAVARRADQHAAVRAVRAGVGGGRLVQQPLDGGAAAC